MSDAYLNAVTTENEHHPAAHSLSPYVPIVKHTLVGLERKNGGIIISWPFNPLPVRLNQSHICCWRTNLLLPLCPQGMCHFFIPLYTDLLHKINFLAGSDKKPSLTGIRLRCLVSPCFPIAVFLGGCQITQTGMGTVRKCHFVCLGAGDKKTTVTLIKNPPSEQAWLFFPLPKSTKIT